MWKEPRLEDIQAPREIKEKINQSIFYNSEGHLDGADISEIIQSFVAILLLWGGLSILSGFAITLIFPAFPYLNALIVGFAILLFLLCSYLFYRWGWKTYEQAWYHFDDRQRIFTVIKIEGNKWDLYEVPYEQVTEIEWTGGKNGKAIIHAGSLKFSTNRANEKRMSSVTELWVDLAKFDARMTGWPMTLVCQQCGREFGHHIGTAICPFDQIVLIDPEVKGRIDPQELHPDDIDRF